MPNISPQVGRTSTPHRAFVVTGAAMGLGRAIATRMAEEDAAVAVLDHLESDARAVSAAPGWSGPHVGEPDDVAWGAVYLASDGAKSITGSELVIGGDYTAR